MKQTRQFDDIEKGEILRILITPQYYDDGGKPFWSFGVVSSTYLRDFIYVYAPSCYGCHEYRIRRDGMNKSGKGAFQVAFRTTSEEQKHPLIKEFLSKKDAYETAEKELNKVGRDILSKLQKQETGMFQEYPL